MRDAALSNTSARSTNLRDASAISALFLAASADILVAAVCFFKSPRVPKAIQAATIPTITKAQFAQNGSVSAGILQDFWDCLSCWGAAGCATTGAGMLLVSFCFCWVGASCLGRDCPSGHEVMRSNRSRRRPQRMGASLRQLRQTMVFVALNLDFDANRNKEANSESLRLNQRIFTE